MSLTPPPPDAQALETLVARAQAGDEGAFGEIFTGYYDVLWRFVGKRVANHELEDVLSDIWLRVVKSIKRYEARPGVGFRAWLYRLARNTIIDHYRKQKDITLEARDDDDEESFALKIADENPLPDELADHAFNVAKLTAVLNLLPTKYREVLYLRYRDGLSHAEVAAVIGKTEGNVRVMCLRGVKMAKEIVG